MKTTFNRNLENEFSFTSSRSSGPGGQNVNKVNTKVELRFKVDDSTLLSDIEKTRIKQHLKNRINVDGELIITSQTERSQLKNKEKTMERLYQLIGTALKPKKKRKPTKPTKSSIEARLKRKKMLSDKKSFRKKI